MIKNGFILLLALATCAPAALTTAPRKGPQGNRFLFVVDTSSSMKRLENSGRQVAFDLIYSGIEERMQPGDSFGIWTFADSIKAGVFPVQTWTPEKSMDLASQVSRFLKEQGNARASRIDTAITNAEHLIKSVRDVDIVIITSAATRFKPDDTWAMLLQNWKGRVEEARKNNKAMIVTLAGRGGQVRQATIALQGERLQLAAPPERKPAPMAQSAPVTEPSTKPAREPIIMRGNSKGRPVEEIPTKFGPPPADPQVIEPAAEPSPVPVVGTDKPVVAVPPITPELTVAAREPGVAKPIAAAQAPAVSARMLIIAGAALMIMAGVLGIAALAHIRRRNRVSYISQSLANTPADKL